MPLPLFTETQKFKQVWIWLLLLIVLGITLATEFLVHTVPADSTLIVRIISIAIPLLLVVIFYLFRLDTKIDETGIYYRFYPVHIIDNKIGWELIDRIYVRQYSPLREYGGWGIRGLGKNRALNVSGNMGIQIELKNGKRLLLGTRKPDEAEAVLAQLVASGLIKGQNDTITSRDRF